MDFSVAIIKINFGVVRYKHNVEIIGIAVCEFILAITFTLFIFKKLNLLKYELNLYNFSL
jgi:hypothetical protein